MRDKETRTDCRRKDERQGTKYLTNCRNKSKLETIPHYNPRIAAGMKNNTKSPNGFTIGESRFIAIMCEKYGGRKENILDAVKDAYEHTNRETAINQLRLLKKRYKVMNEIDLRLGLVTDLSNSEDLAKELLRRARDENETPTMRQKYLSEYAEIMGFKRKGQGDTDLVAQLQAQQIDGNDRTLMATLRERLLLSATGKLTQVIAKDTAKTTAKQEQFVQSEGGGMPQSEGTGDEGVP